MRRAMVVLAISDSRICCPRISMLASSLRSRRDSEMVPISNLDDSISQLSKQNAKLERSTNTRRDDTEAMDAQQSGGCEIGDALRWLIFVSLAPLFL